MPTKIICNVCTKTTYNRDMGACMKCYKQVEKELNELLHQKLIADTIEQIQKEKYHLCVFDIS